MQTILGAGGVIGNNLASALRAYTTDIRLASRHPKAVSEGDQLMATDLLNAQQVQNAVEGSEVVYLTAGLPYRASLWEVQWPRIMDHVIAACERSGSKLVFFDNVYAYGKVTGWMTESTPLNPCSRKGQVRRLLAEKIDAAVDSGRIQAQIVRAADFYGPHTPLSFISVMVLDKLARGKKAQLLCSAQTLHSLTYTPDAGRATALLGNTSNAYNQVWHAPTDPATLSGEALVKAAAEILGVEPRYQVVSRGMIRLLGWFVPVLRETVEMLYQNEEDYQFSSGKFRQAFPEFRITSYQEGLAACTSEYRKQA